MSVVVGAGVSHQHDYCYSDGLISYDELLSYFQSANSQLRERFTHLFVEHTFIGTPVCEHCKGMVSDIFHSD